MKAISQVVRPLAWLAFCGLYSSTLAAQSAPPAAQQTDKQQPPFVFKTSTRLVVVDVVVTNSKGEPISDLKAEDFVVTENGVAQPVRSFSFQQQTARKQSTPEAVGQKTAPDIVTNIPRYKKGDIWSVIVLDALNSPMLDQSNTRQQLLHILEKLPDQPVAVYVLGTQLRLIQDFSSDPQVLRQAIAGMKSKASPLLDNPKGGHEAERYEGVWFISLPAQAQASILRWEGESTASRTRSRLQLTLDALNAIAFNLKSLPGRKNLIWVSEGFPFSIEPGQLAQAHDPRERIQLQGCGLPDRQQPA